MDSTRARQSTDHQHRHLPQQPSGSDTGRDCADAIYTLFETARLNGIDPRAWLAHAITNMVSGHPKSGIDELPPLGLSPQLWKLLSFASHFLFARRGINPRALALLSQ
jgi:hypothetical protein